MVTMQEGSNQDATSVENNDEDSVVKYEDVVKINKLSDSNIYGDEEKDLNGGDDDVDGVESFAPEKQDSGALSRPGPHQHGHQNQHESPKSTTVGEVMAHKYPPPENHHYVGCGCVDDAEQQLRAALKECVSNMRHSVAAAAAVAAASSSASGLHDPNCGCPTFLAKAQSQSTKKPGKGLLKRRNDGGSASNNAVNGRARRGSRVRFSDTLTVFCEDYPEAQLYVVRATTELPPEMCMVMYDPPPEYRDLMPFEPPEAYKDQQLKVQQTKNQQVIYNSVQTTRNVDDDEDPILAELKKRLGVQSATSEAELEAQLAELLPKGIPNDEKLYENVENCKQENSTSASKSLKMNSSHPKSETENEEESESSSASSVIPNNVNRADESDSSADSQDTIILMSEQQHNKNAHQRKSNDNNAQINGSATAANSTSKPSVRFQPSVVVMQVDSEPELPPPPASLMDSDKESVRSSSSSSSDGHRTGGELRSATEVPVSTALPAPAYDPQYHHVTNHQPIDDGYLEDDDDTCSINSGRAAAIARTNSQVRKTIERTAMRRSLTRVTEVRKRTNVPLPPGAQPMARSPTNQDTLVEKLRWLTSVDGNEQQQLHSQVTMVQRPPDTAPGPPLHPGPGPIPIRPVPHQYVLHQQRPMYPNHPNVIMQRPAYLPADPRTISPNGMPIMLPVAGRDYRLVRRIPGESHPEAAARRQQQQLLYSQQQSQSQPNLDQITQPQKPPQNAPPPLIHQPNSRIAVPPNCIPPSIRAPGPVPPQYVMAPSDTRYVIQQRIPQPPYSVMTSVSYAPGLPPARPQMISSNQPPTQLPQQHQSNNAVELKLQTMPDELEMFVQQDMERTERIKKRYSVTEEEDPTFGFARRPSVRGIRQRYSSTTELQQMGKEMSAKELNATQQQQQQQHVQQQMQVGNRMSWSPQSNDMHQLGPATVILPPPMPVQQVKVMLLPRVAEEDPSTQSDSGITSPPRGKTMEGPISSGAIFPTPPPSSSSSSSSTSEDNPGTGTGNGVLPSKPPMPTLNETLVDSTTSDAESGGTVIYAMNV